MRNHTGDIKGYHRTSKAYYSSVCKDVEINLGLYNDDGSTSGEFHIRWIELSGKLCARLECFEDSWSTLSNMPELIEAFGKLDSKDIQEDEFAIILDELGFKDLTDYDAPYNTDKKMVTIEIEKWKAEKLNLL